MLSGSGEYNWRQYSISSLIQTLKMIVRGGSDLRFNLVFQWALYISMSLILSQFQLVTMSYTAILYADGKHTITDNKHNLMNSLCFEEEYEAEHELQCTVQLSGHFTYPDTLFKPSSRKHLDIVNQDIFSGQSNLPMVVIYVCHSGNLSQTQLLILHCLLTWHLFFCALVFFPSFPLVYLQT